MVLNCCPLLAVSTLLAPGAAAQGGPALLAAVPDAAVVVAAARAPASAVAALGAWLEPLPPGLPPEVVGQIGAGLAAVRAALGGATTDWVHQFAAGGAVAAWVPGPGGGWQWLVVTEPADATAAAAFCRARLPTVPCRVDGGRLHWGTCTAPAGGRWAASPLAAAAASPGVVGAVDLAALRQRFAGNWSLPTGAAQVVFAPVVHALAQAAWLQVGLTAVGDRLQVTATADASLRSTAFGALLADGDPPGVAWPEAAIAGLRLDRSLRRLLAEPASFLPPEGVQAVAAFLSIADALDGPRTSFVDDLLGGLHEPITLLALPAAAADADEAGPITLPAFAAVAGVRDQRAVDLALRTAQLLATIANAERAQRGEAPFAVRRRRDELGHGLIAEAPPWRGPGLPPPDRQLSPTVWAAGGRLAVASTTAAALAACAAEAAPAGGRGGDQFVLRGRALAAALAASRPALELARMLDEGEDRGEAQRFFAVLERVAAALDVLEVRLEVEAATTRLEVLAERWR
ncbi:MAG: hypothetical protein KF830_00815 [Planctomycetes bacterium]|nr:hypothetical protein [Planctomycetota bacterium]